MKKSIAKLTRQQAARLGGLKRTKNLRRRGELSAMQRRAAQARWTAHRLRQIAALKEIAP